MAKTRGDLRSDLPQPLPWNEREAVLGDFKGARSRMLDNLIKIVDGIAEGRYAHESDSWPEPGNQDSVGSIIGPIYNCGMFLRTGGRITLSADGMRWYANKDTLLLIAIVHSNVRFIGEILAELLAGPMSHPKLLSIAQSKYGFGWTTDGPIQGRTKWLEAAGLLISYSHKLHLSDRGREFLRSVKVHDPATSGGSSLKLKNPPPQIAELLSRMGDGSGRARAASCYIPASRSGQVDTIRDIVASCASPKTDHSLTLITATKFSVSNATAEKFIRTLILFGLLERCSPTELVGTSAALAWTETSYPVDLARIVHANIWYFGEIIGELNNSGRLTFGEILGRCNRYSTGRHQPLKRGGLTARIALLESLDLITYISNHRYGITTLGLAFYQSVPTIHHSNPTDFVARPGTPPRGDSDSSDHERITLSKGGQAKPTDRLKAAPDSENDAQRRKNVMVAFGRNTEARLAMFDFLRSIGLNPIEWARARALSKEVSPYIGQILDAAFNAAQAVVVLFTPDEIVNLRSEYADGAADPDLGPALQARPNVLFEAGMAMGRDPDRTVLVELGRTRGLSDLTGRYFVQMSNGAEHRQELAERLRDAGCDVDTSGSDWLRSGSFSIPEEPSFQSQASTKPVNGRQGATADPDETWTRSGNFLLRINAPKSAGFGLFTVLGEAKNNGPAVQMASVTAVFSDSAGRILGSATGAVSQIAGGELKAFSLNSTDDLSVYSSSRVQIDSAV